MAEEDEGVNTGPTPDHAEQPGHPPTDPAQDEPTGASAPSSEWTASDARGPLNEAKATVAGDPVTADEAVAPDVKPSAASSAPASAPVAVQAKRTSYWPVAFGLVVGAGVGAAVALWIYPAVQPPPPGPDPQLAASVAALSTKVAALEAKPTPDNTATLDAKSTFKSLAALDAKMTALQATVAKLPAATAASPPPAPFDPSPLEQKIAGLTSSLDALKTQSAGTQDLATKVDGLGTAISGVQKQAETNASGLQTIQDQQKSLEGQQKNLEGKVGTPALAVAAGSLVQKIDAGQPYELEVEALASFGADPVKLAVLKQNATTGVPSVKMLASSFEPLAEPILATGHKAPPDASFMDRMKSGMSSLVSIHRADDVSGSDLSSRVGRIQGDLTHDDLADALATWMALPDDAKAKSDTWAAQVKTSAEAQAAARSLQSDAIAAMGAKKS